MSRNFKLRGSGLDSQLKRLRIKCDERFFDGNSLSFKGRAIAGKSAGGKAYGYRNVQQFGLGGEPIRGERVIDDAEAQVVRRIFSDYAGGTSPKKIAEALNKEPIPGPQGRGWGASTLHGNRDRGTGILNNELYVGRQIWNRLSYAKDPDTGKRVSRLNPQSEWVVTEVPEMRIIEQSCQRTPRRAARQRYRGQGL